MTNGCFKSIKPLTLIVLLLCTLLCISCKEEKIYTPPPSEYCGDGTGDFNFNSVGSIDTTFDCNTSGHFVINLEPNINNSFIGFNRLYLRLEKAGQIYRSNYVEFYSSDTTTQQLEWGGSLPSGTYEMRGFLWNIQLNSTCRDSVYRIENKHLGDIHITQFTNPSKVIVIEYDCQDSDTGIIDRYDVFLSPHTSEYMNIAFNIANTRNNVITYNTNLTPELIRYDPTIIADYIEGLKQWGNEMFLYGIKGFKDALGNLIVERLGTTILKDTISFAPDCSTGSLIAIKACINNAVYVQRYKVDYNDLVTAVTVHELGHQRGVLHHTGHSSVFCIMNEQFIVDDYLCRHLNPHFCDNCIYKIKNITW
jgi:hypothetical protein